MLLNPNIPYPPKTVVYFIVEDAIRKGVVESVYCKLTNAGEEPCWTILEYITECEPVKWSVADVENIALCGGSIMQRANKHMRTFQIANKIEQSTEVAEDIFE